MYPFTPGPNFPALARIFPGCESPSRAWARSSRRDSASACAVSSASSRFCARDSTASL